MTAMALLIILFALAMVVGPIMLMRPSPMQTKLANLRNLAIKAGCRVHLSRHPWDNTIGELACYSLPWPTEQLKRFQGVQLSVFKKNYRHDIHFFEFWDWQKKDEGALIHDLEWKNAFRDFLKTLPPNIHGIEINKLGCTLCLREKLQKPEAEISAEILASLQGLQGIFKRAAS